MDAFLDNVHQQLDSNRKKVIVTGNDSADLDSIISSLLFAYLSQLQDKSKLYIPLVKVPQADLELRPELNHVFTHVGLDYKKLVTIDQIKLEPTDIILVDHNHLTSPFDTEAWSHRVVGVLDHHVDEHLYPDAPIRTVDMVGSCVTLVLQHFHINTTSPWLTDDISLLAMAPLLVDTINLKWELNRTTQADVHVFDTLRNTEFDTTAYFKEIEKVKSQVDTMSNRDILRRDYKEFKVNGYTIGTSAVTWYFDAWIQRNSSQVISEAALEYAKERHLDLQVIFTAFDHDKEGEGDYRRELAIFVVNKDLLPVKQQLEKDHHLNLSPTQFDNFFKQGNITMSRKQVWPLIKQFVEAQPKKVVSQL